MTLPSSVALWREFVPLIPDRNMARNDQRRRSVRGVSGLLPWQLSRLQAAGCPHGRRVLRTEPVAQVGRAGIGLGARVKNIELGKEGEQCRTPTSS